jgi:hypothetical protein
MSTTWPSSTPWRWTGPRPAPSTTSRTARPPSPRPAAIARRLGLGAPQPWPIEGAVAALGFGHAVYSLGSNSRVRGGRARAELDWSPKHASLIAWIENEMRVR